MADTGRIFNARGICVREYTVDGVIGHPAKPHSDRELMPLLARKKHYARENRERAARVFGIVLANYSAKSEGNETALTDLLSDIRHFCDAKNLCLGDIDRTAHGHYLAELEQAATGVTQ